MSLFSLFKAFCSLFPSGNIKLFFFFVLVLNELFSSMLSELKLLLSDSGVIGLLSSIATSELRNLGPSFKNPGYSLFPKDIPSCSGVSWGTLPRLLVFPLP